VCSLIARTVTASGMLVFTTINSALRTFRSRVAK